MISSSPSSAKSSDSSALWLSSHFLSCSFGEAFTLRKKAPDTFSALLVAGLTAKVGLQALLNIAVVTATIPTTGIALPFFSYGGTALVMQLAERESYSQSHAFPPEKS